MSRKKSKKSFSDNLESFFQENMLEDNPQDNISMIENDSSKDKKTKHKGATAAKKNSSNKSLSKKTSRKSFSTNLEQFFKNSLDGVLDGIVTDGIVSGAKRNILGKGRKKAIGLDLLIKRTTKKNVNETIERQKPSTERVTVVLDTKKIEELKRIAESKGAKQKLTQIIKELVAEYIEESNK
jgi:hypothetical protein